MDGEITFDLGARRTGLLAGFALVAGTASMVVSLYFLYQANPEDIITGAAGTVAGPILIATGVLLLLSRSESPRVSRTAARLIPCLGVLLPPLVAIFSWPVLYFMFFLHGVCCFLPIVLLGCLGAAMVIASKVAPNLAAVLGWRRVNLLRGILFGFQLACILASWPIFGWTLRWMESMGMKVGWS